MKPGRSAGTPTVCFGSDRSQSCSGDWASLPPRQLKSPSLGLIYNLSGISKRDMAVVSHIDYQPALLLGHAEVLQARIILRRRLWRASLCRLRIARRG